MKNRNNLTEILFTKKQFENIIATNVYNCNVYCEGNVNNGWEVIFEKNRKKFSSRNSGAIRAYSMAVLLRDIRKRERRTAKNSTYFHFLCRTNRTDGAFLSFKDHFPAIPSNDCSHVEALLLRRRIADTRSHKAYD